MKHCYVIHHRDVMLHLNGTSCFQLIQIFEGRKNNASNSTRLMQKAFMSFAEQQYVPYPFRE